MSQHPSDLALDRYALGRLDTAARVTLDHHLDRCEACRLRLAEYHGYRHRPLHPAPWGEKAMRSHTSSESRASRWYWFGALVPAALVLFLITRPGPEHLGTGYLGTKGGHAAPSLVIYVQRSGAAMATPWRDEVVHPGDLLQWVVAVPAPRHVAIYGCDSSGRCAAYAPERGRALALGAGEHPLDVALELDEVLGPEALVAVFCPDPFLVDSLHPVPSGGARPNWVPAGCELDQKTLTKVPRGEDR